MVAQMYISKGVTDNIHPLFAPEHDEWVTISLHVNNDVVCEITEPNTEAFFEVFNISDANTTYNVDSDRLTYLVGKYGDHSRFVDFKKLIRVILNNNVTQITITQN